VSAGVLVSGSAGAQDDHLGGIEVVLGGSTESGVVAANKNTITADHDRGYTFFTDNQVFFLANGATEGGILYGSEIELEVGTGGLDGSSPETFTVSVPQASGWTTEPPGPASADLGGRPTEPERAR
jgi:hypothetical protein